MASIPSSKLDKALAKRGFTTTSRASWQELMARHDTVPGSAILAPDVLHGFTGSWAAQFGLGDSVKDTTTALSPAQAQRQVNHLGLPGMAEINFRPYDWGTTRHGKYGPSLLGHPVSFEVVGPTTKSPFLLHQWRVVAGLTQDTLTIDDITWGSTAAVPVTLPVALDTIPEIYGITTIPEEGLYVVVTLTGAKGALDDVGGGFPGVGGLGDGTIGQKADAYDPRTAIEVPSGVGQKAKFEVFRVASLTTTDIVLAEGKRLSDFFTFPGTTAIIRAITLVKPAAARLVAVPGSGEQVFAFVPPEKALTSDLLPPAAAWASGGGDPWLGYNTSGTVGAMGDYDQKVALPIPKPVRLGTGRLQGIFGEGVIALDQGLLRLVLDDTTTFRPTDFGKVVRIYSVAQFRSGNWATASLDGGTRIGDPELDRLIGYWEVVAATAGAPNSYNLRMVAQVDPLTGVPFLGSSEYLHMAQTGLVGGMSVRLQWTLHDPVSSLWTDYYLQADKLDSARLRNLIDPSWVRPTAKNIDIPDAEASPARPDRAAINTITGEDPGSLMDLGFRPVFYPAKVSTLDPTKLVPDFERPITSNELVLDPAVTTETQFLEVDYSAGLVYLSHAPVAGAWCHLAPDAAILTNAANPRKEMTFFASFVPFSQEPGQRGVVPRVTGGQPVTGDGSACGGLVESQDVYGARLHWPLAAGQTITAGTTTQIRLDVQLDALSLPPTGFIEVVSGYDVPVGPAVWTDGNNRRVSTFGYTAATYSDVLNANNTTLEGCFGGGISGVSHTTTTLVTRYSAVLRREVVCPNRGDGTTGTDIQSDTTYGASKRGSALRFKRAATSVEPDGSVTVDTRDPLTLSHQTLFSDLFSSWVLSGGVMTKTVPMVGSTLEFSEVTVLIEGVRTVLPAKSYSGGVGGASGSKYIYIDGTNPACPVYATGTALPLPDGTYPPVTPHHVLLGQYSWVGANVTAWYDLRQPLTDIDKRLDITVGVPQGHDQPSDAHFSTLADAVAFAALTMAPVSGYSGKCRRIKVIGPTTEDVTKLPIRPMTPGLIIEGASRRLDGTNAVPLEISWGGATAPALFDLSGCDGLVIRDVNFRFIDSAVSATPRDRTLFTVDYTSGGNVLRNVLIENVTLNGLAHGFLFCANNLDAATGFDGVTLRNCMALDLTDFAVICSTTVSQADNLVVDRCRFDVRKSTDPHPPELALGDNTGVLCHPGSGALRWVVQDTYLYGGRFGIHLNGTDHVVRNVTVESPDKCGMAFIDGTRVQLDRVDLLGCYTVAGNVLTLTDQVGLFINRFGPAWVRDSRVTMSAPGTGWAAYSTYNTATMHLTSCDLAGSVEVGPDSRVTDCHILDGLRLGARSHAKGNFIEVVAGPGDLDPEALCVMTGNVVEGAYNAVYANGTGAYLAHNVFAATGTHYISTDTKSLGDTFGGRLAIEGGSSFTGCLLLDGISDTASGAGPVSVGNVFDGCHMEFTSSATMMVEKSTFTGNNIQVTGADRTLMFDGVENTFIGNQFAGNLTVHLQDTAAGARTGIVFQGNKFRRTDVSLECGLVVWGNYCTIEGNIIEGVDTLNGVGIHAAGHTGLLRGSHFTIAGNVVGRAGVAVGLATILGDSTISGNRVFGTLVAAASSVDLTIVGNVLGEVGVSAGTVLNVQGGTRVTCVGNTCAYNVTFAGGYSAFEANTVYNNGTLSGSTTRYEGNHIIGDATLSGQDSVLSGNTILGNLALTVAATQCLISQNRVALATYLFASDTTCVGCVLGAVSGTYNNLDFKNNTVLGAADFGDAAATKVQNLVGNHFEGTVGLGAFGLTQSVVSGNKFVGAATLDGIYDTSVTGNTCASTFASVGGARNVYSGNRFRSTTAITGQTDTVVQGNLVSSGGAAVGLNMSGCDNYVCVGNLVSGTLTVDDVADGAPGTGVVVGNRAAVIATDNAPVAGTVVVGNRTTNAAGNTNFNTAPGVGPVINDNVEV